MIPACPDSVCGFLLAKWQDVHDADHDAVVAALRTAMGDSEFEDAYAEGAALPAEETVAYAMRGRGERMHRFEDLDEVLSGLQQLMRREPPLAKALGRRPGTKEVRYAHLLSGDVEAWEPPSETAASGVTDENERVAHLEAQVATLQSEVAELKQQMAEFRKQFE